MANALRRLGYSSLQVGRIGLGCMGMSDFYGGVRDEASHIRVLHAAIDLDINSFDTADVYGVGHNEELVSNAFSDRWDKVIVATKFGIRRGPRGEWLGVCGRPEYVKEACEKSLKILGRETIDLYDQHRPDPNVPVEDSVGAMKELVQEGKVRVIGVSEFSAEQIRAAHAVHPITALQPEYSLWTRDVEEDGVLTTCRDLGIAFVAYSPLGRGFLTGAIPDRTVCDCDTLPPARTGRSARAGVAAAAGRRALRAPSVRNEHAAPERNGARPRACLPHARRLRHTGGRTLEPGLPARERGDPRRGPAAPGVAGGVEEAR